MTPSRLTLALTAIEQCLTMALEDHPEDATDADMVEFAIDHVCERGDWPGTEQDRQTAEFVWNNREQFTAAAFAMLVIMKAEAP